MATYQTRAHPHTLVEAYQLAAYEEDEKEEFFTWADQHELNYESGRDEELVINPETDDEFVALPGQFVVKFIAGFGCLSEDVFRSFYELISDGHA